MDGGSGDAEEAVYVKNMAMRRQLGGRAGSGPE